MDKLPLDMECYDDELAMMDSDLDIVDTLLDIEEPQPEEWTIITALNNVHKHAKQSELCDLLWRRCEKSLAYLRDKLGLTNIQIVVLAILVESGETETWKSISAYLHCSRLTVMAYAEEMEELLRKRWIVKRVTRGFGGGAQGFELAQGVTSALCRNEAFVPERLDGFTEQEFVDKLEMHIVENLADKTLLFSNDEEWMLQFASANPHLPLCQEVLQMKDIHAQSLLLMVVFDYAQFANTEDEGLTFRTICDLYPHELECNNMRRRLKDGTHILMRKGLIEHKCEDGVVNTERYMLTAKTKNELLSGYTPHESNLSMSKRTDRNLRCYSEIKEKVLFYNENEQKQVERLANLLQQENLMGIQQRLESEGMRKGVACLFHGAPGTGKTETVLQLARQTGRDIMQIDIAGLRDKWVGESEKNIKAVFSRYKALCKQSEIMPILFFNEADAIFNKRIENVERSVEKMDNAMQNIILQELENLEGILIATTNLTSNLDGAFDRRFLFKIEFKKPEKEVMARIWESMISTLTDDEAAMLASTYDFSGGQIENIARKSTIDYILNGKRSSVEQIREYCDSEVLARKNACRPIAGFTQH